MGGRPHGTLFFGLAFFGPSHASFWWVWWVQRLSNPAFLMSLVGVEAVACVPMVACLMGAEVSASVQWLLVARGAFSASVGQAWGKRGP